LGFFVADEKQKGRIPLWDKKHDGTPSQPYKLLRTVLTDEELREIRHVDIGEPQKALDLLEYKMLVEIERLISGAAAAEASAVEGKRQLQALGDLARIVNESRKPAL
jgi:hypothetical protein